MNEEKSFHCFFCGRDRTNAIPGDPFVLELSIRGLGKDKGGEKAMCAECRHKLALKILSWIKENGGDALNDERLRDIPLPDYDDHDVSGLIDE